MSLSIYCIDTAVAKSKNIGEDEAGTLTLTTAPTETVTANLSASPAVSNSIASPIPPGRRPRSPQRA